MKQNPHIEQKYCMKSYSMYENGHVKPIAKKKKYIAEYKNYSN